MRLMGGPIYDMLPPVPLSTHCILLGYLTRNQESADNFDMSQ